MGQRRVRSVVVFITWLAAIVFVPAETYLTFVGPPYPLPGVGELSGYAVNVLGAGLAVWGAQALRRGKSYAEGFLAAGWAWTTAAAWRATNLRYWYAAEIGELDFGRVELWVGPLFVIVAAVALIGSLVLLAGRGGGPGGSA